MIGETIAHYRITAKLGEGGMGEVYRATDTKLHREVAIKVLPQSFAQNAERMARFTREAQVLASLNHPNIAQIYGVEDRAIVMELVEGEALKGPLPLDTALDYARQIADALEAAHEKGIVHRDLKPANIKITPQGVVKILDFGLAKAAEEPTGDPENSPTQTISPTRLGMILGTAAYMSPEQARGKQVDKRADIWSFGVVLYEMLTGQRLFKGDTVSDTLAAVLNEKPDLERVPTKVRKLLQSCLEKDPRKRLCDIGDVWRLVDELPQEQARATKLPWAIATVLGVIALAVSLIHFRETPKQETVLRYTLSAPENATNLHSFAISPNGRLLAIAAEANGKRQLWLRAMDAFQAQRLPGTDGAKFPFWSPDSRYIGFFAQGKLKKIAAAGGPPQSLCDAIDGQGGSWNQDDVIVFAPSVAWRAAIQRVSAVGGVSSDVIKRKGTSRFPVFLPDGRRFLYVGFGESVEQNGIYLSSLHGDENRRVLADVSSVAFAAGRLLFIRQNTLMAQPFDSASGQARGEAFPVAEDVSFDFIFAKITVSETGVLLYEGSVGPKQMAWYDRGGKLLEAVSAPGEVGEPTISPDGKTVVFRRGSIGVSDLWLRDLSRGGEQRITTDGSTNIAPVWSPHGDRIVFNSNREGGIFNLYQKAEAWTGQDEQLLATANNKVPTQWSRNGLIVYQELDPKGEQDIWVLRVDGNKERKPVLFLRSAFNEFEGQLSPDSHWMAYTSDESGRREVYVQSFPRGESKRQISIGGGEQPRWRADGKELFFVGADGNMMAASGKTGAGAKPSFEPGAPQQLFEAHLNQGGAPIFEYDVTGDGKRFLLNTVAGNSAASPLLNVVVKWDAGLKK
jgi:Tol biopolymer transport system component/predicted Ser/Thr protein kinase